MEYNGSHLTIIEQWSNKQHIMVKAQCRCGNIKTTRRSAIGPPGSGKTVSCGCYWASSVRKTGQDPRSRMWSRAKYRAKQKGLDFNITKEDIVIPDVCPLLSTPMVSPSLDRKDPTKGYVKGNVWVISNRANTLKNDATLEELQTLVENLSKG